MTETVEIIEAATFLVSLSGVVFSLWLCRDAYLTVQRALLNKSAPSIVTISMARLTAEGIHTLLNWMVFIAGITAAFTPVPIGPTAGRPLFQWIWLLLSIGLVALSLINMISTTRVLELIKHEQSARNRKE